MVFLDMSSETLKLMFRTQEVTFNKGKTLFELIEEHQLDVFWGNSAQFSCKGQLQCGVCMVKVFGKTKPMEEKEKLRLKKTGISKLKNIRLACQCIPVGNVVIERPQLI